MLGLYVYIWRLTILISDCSLLSQLRNSVFMSAWKQANGHAIIRHVPQDFIKYRIVNKIVTLINSVSLLHSNEVWVWNFHRRENLFLSDCSEESPSHMYSISISSLVTAHHVTLQKIFPLWWNISPVRVLTRLQRVWWLLRFPTR
jgi:hypothetical protein